MKIEICFMLLSLLLIDSYFSISIYKKSPKNINEENKDNKDQQKGIMHEKFLKYKAQIEKEKRKKLVEALPNCAKFFTNCNFQGIPVLTLCHGISTFPRLAVSAENQSMKKIKSIKIGLDTKVVISFNYGIDLQKPLDFTEDVKCLPDLLDHDKVNSFDLTIAEVKDYSLE